MDDNELVLGFVENDPDVVAQVYRENYHSVLNFVLSNNGNEHDAKDVYQEAMVATWINVKNGSYEAKTGKAIGGYIFQIARFKWLDRLKSKAYRSTVRLVHTNYSDQGAEPDYDHKEDEKWQRLKMLYKKLNDKCKTILTGFYYQKKSLTEIGEELNHDAGTMKTLKYRCMKKLRDLHNETMDE